jgi:O-antigen/teichoic acid export membrane protein
MTIIALSALFFRFGFFSSGSLLLAHFTDEIKQRELIGALLIVSIFIGIIYSSFIFTLSFVIDNIFKTNINEILRILSPILLIIPFQFLIPQISQGTNKINLLAYFNLLPKVIYVICLLSLFRYFSLNVTSLILLHIAALSSSILVIISRFKPLFNNLKINLKNLWNKTLEYGFHVYLGQIADQSTYMLDGILITYFVNTTQLGFYSLAGAITLPMAILSQSLSVSLFKDFVNKDRIPNKVFHFNLCWLGGCVIGFLIFGKFIVVLLFTDKFLPVVPLLVPLAFAAFFQGMYQPYNRFLGAHGMGLWLKNMSFLATTLNVVFNIILIPLYGVIGAAIASVISRFSSFIAHRYYYKKFVSDTL